MAQQKQTLTLDQKVRKRAALHLTPEVAACGGMRLDELQQVVAGTYIMTADQVTSLARRMSIPLA
jgi:hypothetical protein